jgi:hypothetical protein
LTAWHAGTKKAAGIPRALIDCGNFEAREFFQKIVQRQADSPVHVTPDVQPERGRIHGRRNVRKVPPHIEAVVWRKDSLVEHLERRLD